MRDIIETTSGQNITFEYAFSKGLKPYGVTIKEIRTKHVYIWAENLTSAMDTTSDLEAEGFFMLDDNDSYDRNWECDNIDSSFMIYDTSDLWESFISDEALMNTNETPDKDFRVWSAVLGKDDIKITDIQLNYAGDDIIANLEWDFDIRKKLGIPRYITENKNNTITMWAAYTPGKETVYMGVDITTHKDGGLKPWYNTVTVPVELSDYSEQALREMFTEEIAKRCNMTPIEFVESERKIWDEE